MGLSKYLHKSIVEWRKHIALVPLWIVTCAGGCWSVFYLARLAIRAPDVAFSFKDSPEPWQKYEHKQYKFYSPFTDYNAPHPRPRFDK